MQLVISGLLHCSMEYLKNLTIEYFLALLLHGHVKTGGFKEMWSARVLGNIPLSATGQISLVFLYLEFTYKKSCRLFYGLCSS